MDLAARKYHFIEMLMKVENESVMEQLESVLNTDNEIPDFHKAILIDRLEHHKNNPTDVVRWNDVKDTW
ncbi:hypothetical protein Q765_11880 [Flavobacterium rivuli WB 3.3-2 = DSM 21788]|uniref:Addiction module protein n=1 Tax=Flavobacterium rivuli WB 3.3-2 = DSM 21788 TaxID=1121895 RepID=A0A0A2M0W7_9FLAO|nr:hypothetical protein [Flavobacterium rivuli]KGO86272.1 hypothetical protein Q765_11880 [Flavobacterium rivuli WB 3.3-2 = DSM 21788]